MVEARQTVTPATKLTGDIRVPGELAEATLTLILASLSEGESQVDNTPPGIAPLVSTLGGLGVELQAGVSCVTVRGRGLRSMTAPSAEVDLGGTGDAGLLLLTAMACQPLAVRVRAPTDGTDLCRKLLAMLEQAGVGRVAEEEEGVFRLSGDGEMKGVDYADTDLEPSLKLALLLAGMYADGETTIREPSKSRDRVELELKRRGVEVTGIRPDPAERVLKVSGGQTLAPLSLPISGQMELALPLMVAALTVKRSVVRIRKVAVRSDNRAFYDLLRQLGGRLELEDEDQGAADMVARFTPLRSTRVAQGRAERLIAHVPLLAVLATQTEGEFIIRDIDALRGSEDALRGSEDALRGSEDALRGSEADYDLVAHLLSLLRLIGAKVGEYPEGLVIDGGHPLQGTRIDSKGDPGVVQAFAVAGLLASGDMEIEGAECLDGVFPGFFDSLAILKGRKK